MTDSHSCAVASYYCLLATRYLNGGSMGKSRKRGRASKVEPGAHAMVRQVALSLPGVEEGTSYGTPAFRVSGKFLARMREDGESLVIKVEYAAREVLIAADPETFFITDHYSCWPMMLVRLSRVRPEDLYGLLEEAWRNMAPKRLVLAHDASRANSSAAKSSV